MLGLAISLIAGFFGGPSLFHPKLNTGYFGEGPVAEDGLLLDDGSLADFRLIDDNGSDYYMVAD